VLAFLIVGTASASWLGIDEAPINAGDELARVITLTENTQSARFAETTRQSSDTRSNTGTVLNFMSTSAGSIDFASDEIALKTRVIQTGLSPQEYMSVLIPGTLYERIGTSPFGTRVLSRWTEQQIAYDPILSMPGLAALQFDVSSVGMQRVRDELVGSVPTTKFTVVPRPEYLCVIPNGPVEQLSSTITVWVDDQDLLRRITQVESVQLTYRRSVSTPQNARFVTTSTVTFTDFGQRLPIDIPPRVLRPLVPSALPSSATSPQQPSCRNLMNGG